MDSDDAIDILPWPPAELVGQLVTHASLGRRGLIEDDDETDAFERETDRFELEAWAKLELPSWLSAGDADILAAPAGNLDPAQADLCADALLVASTIGWAVRVPGLESLPLPADGRAEEAVLAWAPGPWTPVRNVVASVRVRDDVTLAEERERWELIVWRCSLFQDKDLFDVDREALRDTIGELSSLSLVTNDGEDFTIDDGTPFGALDGDMLDQIAHESEIRLRTLNWVCGFGDSPVTAPLFLDD